MEELLNALESGEYNSTSYLRQRIREVKAELKGEGLACTCTPEDLRDNQGWCGCSASYWRGDLEGELESLERDYDDALDREIAQFDAMGF